MSSIETADPAQLTDPSEDALVAEVSAMLGGADTEGLNSPADVTAGASMPEESESAETTSADAVTSTVAESADAGPLSEAAVEATLGQVETDLMRLQEALNGTRSEVHVEPKLTADKPVAEAPVTDAAAEANPATQEERSATETAAEAIQDSSPASDIDAVKESEAAVAESGPTVEGEPVEDMEPASEVAPISPEPSAERQDEGVESVVQEATVPGSAEVAESESTSPQALDLEDAAVSLEQTTGTPATAAAASEMAAETAPPAPMPSRRWYHPLRMVEGLAAALLEILVLVDIPFAGLSPTIKTMVGCAGIATGVIAVATWGSILYRNLAG